jgi:hypothetical protein
MSDRDRWVFSVGGAEVAKTVADKTCAELLTELTDQQLTADGGQASDHEARAKASFTVLRRNKALAKQYFLDPNSDFDPAA